MNITLNIQAETPEELVQAICGLNGVLGVPVDTPETEKEKPSKPAGKSKPKPKPAEKAEDEKPEEKDSGEEDDGDSDDDEAEPVTVEDLRKKAADVAKAGKQPDVKALLDEFESKSISAIPEDQRADFMKRLEKL